MELLSPAGNFEQLQFSITYGADAVYLAGNKFGMRATAGNFSEDGLRDAVRYAHAHNVLVYLTCNIIPRDEDIALLPDFLSFAQELGVNALIIGDLGIFRLAERVVPNIPRHVSTQAGVLNTETAKAWEDLGASRVILARELSLDAISKIKANLPHLELEAFVHGAMCVSFSGRCLLSQYLSAGKRDKKNNRDANQGNCAQPCRWKYHLVEETRPGEYMPIIEDGGVHILNARDLCMIENVPALQTAGLSSLKIEGRAKSFYYAASITRAYREAIDSAKNKKDLSSIWLEEVRKVSHRHYSSGFYYHKDGGGEYLPDAHYIRDWDVIAVVESCDETGNATISGRNRFFVGDTLEVLMPSGDPFSFLVEKIVDAKGISISVAPHPMAILTLTLPCAVPPLSILRRKNP